MVQEYGNYFVPIPRSCPNALNESRPLTCTVQPWATDSSADWYDHCERSKAFTNCANVGGADVRSIRNTSNSTEKTKLDEALLPATPWNGLPVEVATPAESDVKHSSLRSI